MVSCLYKKCSVVFKFCSFFLSVRKIILPYLGGVKIVVVFCEMLVSFSSYIIREGLLLLFFAPEFGALCELVCLA